MPKRVRSIRRYSAAHACFPTCCHWPGRCIIASDIAKFCGARLAGIEAPRYEDVEFTFAELQARIAKTTAFLQTLDARQIDGTEGKEISFKSGGRELKMSGLDYLAKYVLPNVYFHVTTAYAILRHNGVELGKADFLGRLG
jgi:hypothetical protein